MGPLGKLGAGTPRRELCSRYSSRRNLAATGHHQPHRNCADPEKRCSCLLKPEWEHRSPAEQLEHWSRVPALLARVKSGGVRTLAPSPRQASTAAAQRSPPSPGITAFARPLPRGVGPIGRPERLYCWRCEKVTREARNMVRFLGWGGEPCPRGVLWARKGARGAFLHSVPASELPIPARVGPAVPAPSRQ